MYDNVVQILGKNRKLLLNAFRAESMENGNLTFNTVKNIINKILKEHLINLTDNNWKSLIGFAEKGGYIDY